MKNPPIGDGDDWTPRQALEFAIEHVDEEHAKDPDAIEGVVIVFLNSQDRLKRGGWRAYVQAGTNCRTFCGALSETIYMKQADYLSPAREEEE